MIGCILCDFKSGSAFSTNLKVHLRTYHREKFVEVMQLEAAQKHLRASAVTTYENAGRTAPTENAFGHAHADPSQRFTEDSDESLNRLRTNLCDLLYFQLYEAAKRGGHLDAINCPEFGVSRIVN